MSLKRFGVSIPEDLLSEFDELIMKKGYIGRSEAIRDAMRLFITESEWEAGEGEMSATLTIVYGHRPKLISQLIKAQHQAKATVISTTHIHVSHSYCLEVLTIRGTRHEIEELNREVSGLRGVVYSKLFAFSVPDDDHEHHHH